MILLFVFAQMLTLPSLILFIEGSMLTSFSGGIDDLVGGTHIALSSTSMMKGLIELESFELRWIPMLFVNVFSTSEELLRVQSVCCSGDIGMLIDVN